MSTTRAMLASDIGEVPTDWDVVPLSELFDFRNGLNTDKSAYGRGTPFVNILEVITRSHLYAADIPGLVEVPPAVRDRFSVRRGDVLFNRTSETQDEVGLAAAYLDEVDVVFGGFVIRGRPRAGSRIVPSFAGYALRSAAVRHQMVAKGQGAIHANIGQGELGRVRVAIPNQDEQEVIAGVLGDVDESLERLRRLIEKKRRLRAGVSHALLAGSTRLGGFDGEWPSTSMEASFDFLPTASNPRSDLTASGEVDYVHYGDIHGFAFASLDCDRITLPRIDRRKVSGIPRLRDGDVVMVDASEDYAGIGKMVELRNVGVRQVVPGLHTMLLRPRPGTIAVGFGSYVQFLPAVRQALVRLATGVSVFGISKANMQGVRFILPSLDEQAAIATVLSDLDTEIRELELLIDKTNSLKVGMAQELLSGRTRLT